MLLRWIVMLSVAVAGLSLAACAEVIEALVASKVLDAAQIGATQASLATTQTADQLADAATQMSNQAENGTSQPISLPNLPPIGKGTLIIYSPKFVIIQTNGRRYIFIKNPAMEQYLHPDDSNGGGSQ